MKNSKKSRLYLWSGTLVVISIVLIVSQYVFTIDIRHDKQTAEDLTLIEERLHQSEEIVDSLEELELPKEVSRRAQERGYTLSFLGYGDDSYEYELCAEFKTDTLRSDKVDYLTYNEHKDGKQCYQRETFNLDVRIQPQG